MKQPDRPLYALFWMTLSAVGFSVMAVFVKTLGPSVPQFELVFFRSFVNLLVVLPWMLHTREPVLPPRKSLVGLLTLRGLAGFGGLSCLFYTVTHLPLSIAMLLGWTSPVFVILFSRIFLGERLTRKQLGAVLFAFAGMSLLVLKVGPSASGILALPFLPFLIGIIGAAFSGLAYVAVRAATARVGVNTIIFYFVGVSTLLSAPLAARNFTIPTWEIAFQLIFLGLFASLGQFTMTQGFRHAPAALVSTMSLLNAAFSALFGWFLFGERLNSIQWVGLWVVAGAIGYLGFYGYRPDKTSKAALVSQQPG